MVPATKFLWVSIMVLWTPFHVFGVTSCSEHAAEPRDSTVGVTTSALIIDSVQFANVDKKGRVIDDYGETIEGARVKYLAQRIVCRAVIPDTTITLDVKLTDPQGELMRDGNSPAGCSYRVTIRTEAVGECQLQYLGKFKAKFGKGYRIEIWEGPVCLLSAPLPTRGVITHIPIMVRTSTSLVMNEEYRKFLRMSPSRREMLLQQLYMQNYTGPFMKHYVITGWKTVEK